MKEFQNDDVHFHCRYDDYIPSGICMAWVATAVIGASALASAGAQIYSANKASQAQTSATQQATDAQLSMFNRTQANLQPFETEGVNATNSLNAQLPTLTSPIVMNEATLEQTPGYQFNLTQGLKATQNSAAARGLGISGAALKGASTFATGLADSTYQNQFANQVTNQTNAYNRLKGLIDTGENAAAQSGYQGVQTGAQIGGNIVGAGNAQAAGYNATGNAVSNAASNIGGYYAYKGLYGGGGNNTTPNPFTGSPFGIGSPNSPTGPYAPGQP